jgi:hypothetical protein
MSNQPLGTLPAALSATPANVTATGNSAGTAAALSAYVNKVFVPAAIMR